MSRSAKGRLFCLIAGVAFTDCSERSVVLSDSVQSADYDDQNVINTMTRAEAGLAVNRFVGILSIVLMVSVVLGQEATKPAGAAPSTPDYSGMYSFLQDGEFVQLTVEEQGQVTGFVSRYGDQQGDRRAFVDHFFKQSKLVGKKLNFTTEIAQNTFYEFKGTVERGEGKKPTDEAYYVLKGTLTQYTLDTSHKTTSKSQTVAFKSFPQEVEAGETK